MRRDRIKIYGDVLRFCMNAQTKTAVMRRCIISGTQIKRIFRVLLDNKLLEPKEEKRRDKTGAIRVYTVYQTTSDANALLSEIDNVEAKLRLLGCVTK